MNEQRIEPCPWCGTPGRTVEDIGGKVYVTCTGDVYCTGGGPTRDSEETAISAWNEVAGLRAEVARLKAEIEEIEPGAADKRRWRA